MVQPCIYDILKHGHIRTPLLFKGTLHQSTVMTSNVELFVQAVKLLYKQANVKGYVIYDTTVRESLVVAYTAAGVHDH